MPSTTQVDTEWRWQWVRPWMAWELHLNCISHHWWKVSVHCNTLLLAEVSSLMSVSRHTTVTTIAAFQSRRHGQEGVKREILKSIKSDHCISPESNHSRTSCLDIQEAMSAQQYESSCEVCHERVHVDSPNALKHLLETLRYSFFCQSVSITRWLHTGIELHNIMARCPISSTVMQ